MKWKKITVGPVQENTYLLFNEQKEAVVFDPGSEPDRILQKIELYELKIKAILLTHAHFDHIGAMDAIRLNWDVPVYVHEKEQDWLVDPRKNGSAFFGQQVVAKRASHLLYGGEHLQFGSIELEVLETPGHSPGSVSYYAKEADLVFSGDALFSGSIGRTDLHGGNQKTLLKSIHDVLLELPEQTIVLSGHGPETTIGKEMDSNPFLGGF